MITRRYLLRALVTVGVVPTALATSTDSDHYELDQLTFPPVNAIKRPELFGYSEPSQPQKSRAAAIVQSTPKGPTPLEIAQSFVYRFFLSDPDAISQWPAPSARNPLIVEFFSATMLQAANDMIAWCEAFANWCLERSGRYGSRNASSQSFLDENKFKLVSEPKRGDIAVFTCFDRQTKKSLGIGHVAFFKEFTTDDRVEVIGGNQSSDGHSSIISEARFSRADFDVRRHVDGKYIACTIKLEKFVRIT